MTFILERLQRDLHKNTLKITLQWVQPFTLRESHSQCAKPSPSIANLQWQATMTTTPQLAFIAEMSIPAMTIVCWWQSPALHYKRFLSILRKLIMTFYNSKQIEIKGQANQFSRCNNTLGWFGLREGSSVGSYMHACIHSDTSIVAVRLPNGSLEPRFAVNLYKQIKFLLHSDPLRLISSCKCVENFPLLARSNRDFQRDQRKRSPIDRQDLLIKHLERSSKNS